MKRPLRTVLAAAITTAGLITLGLQTPLAAAAPVPVDSVPALQSALDAAEPGDTIEVQAGTYPTTAAIVISQSGTSVAPISVVADGPVVFTGSNGFEIQDADHIRLVGFDFRHESGLVITEGAEHVVVQGNRFALTTAGTAPWLRTRASDTTIEGNVFSGRTSGGVYVAIDGPQTGTNTGAVIRDNYFGFHKFTGSNGGEAVRLGLSTAGSMVERNVFEQTDGDPEAISIKSPDNVIRGNVFLDSRGTINIRFGNRNVIEDNVIVGGFGGIRILSDDHVIRRNLIAFSNGTPLAIADGDTEDGCVSGGCYDRPDRVELSGNVLIANKRGIMGQAVRPYGPQDFTIDSNRIVGSDSGIDLVILEHEASSFHWAGNILAHGAPGAIPADGYHYIDDAGYVVRMQRLADRCSYQLRRSDLTRPEQRHAIMESGCMSGGSLGPELPSAPPRLRS